MRGHATKPPARFEVTCDGDRMAGHAGAVLLVELADRLGLTTALGWRRRVAPMLVRADTGGTTHALVDHLRERGVRFSVSLPADERVRAAVLAVPAGAWQPAVDAGGQPRAGAEVAELATVDLAGWPAGTRPICRREDPHPGQPLHPATITQHPSTLDGPTTAS